MLNIISRSLSSNKVGGPKKVAENLIKGLEKIDYPYVINKKLDSCGRLWIHDDMEALEKIDQLDSRIKIVAGPNLFIPSKNYPNFPENIKLNRVVLLQPSNWVKQMNLDFGFNQGKIDVWPTGIDLDEFKPRDKASKDYVLIYFKQRFEKELEEVIGVLNKKSIAFKIVTYGDYKEEEYKGLLSGARYLIWLGTKESQGIALEESLASNVPIIVLDVSYVGQWVPSEAEKEIFTKEMAEYIGGVTVAPYFDQSCGLKIKDIKKFNGAIDRMEEDWRKFEPRNFIVKNLSLEKQAKDFLNIYDKHWDTIKDDEFQSFDIKLEKYRSGLYIKLQFLIINFVKDNKRVFKIYKACKSIIKDLVRK